MTIIPIDGNHDGEIEDYPHLRLLMCVARNGLMSRGEGDDMIWPGDSIDKRIFQLLTMADDRPIFAGRKTYELMPRMDHRVLYPISRDPEEGIDLLTAATNYPGSWLIGGPEIAVAALQMRLITRAVISWLSHDVPPFDGQDGTYYQGTLAPHMPKRSARTIALPPNLTINDGVVCRIYNPSSFATINMEIPHG